MANDTPNGIPPANGTPSGKPARYGRRAAPGEVSVDPSVRVPLSAPNFGRDPLPQIITFAGMQSTLSHTYRNPDEAIRHSIDNARFMRNDCSIMECLEARQRATALLNYHLEPEDPKDPQQKQLATDLTSILEEIERFTEYRRNLLEAVWAGRTAIQNRWEWRTVRGKKRLCIRKWMPVNGDKLAFRYDDGSGKYDPNQIGIKVGGVFMQQDVLAGDRVIESTEFGRAYFLEPWERSLLTVHKHMIEDGAFEDPISAGRVHGVGVRDRIYWCWYQKQETMAQLMEVIQRTGTGFTIYYYQYGNNENKREMLDIAQKQAPTNTILMPRMSEDPSMNANGIERIEPSTAGIDAMKSIIHEFFGHQIKRYILGQILSSESAATGLGSGVADLHQDTFAAIVQYDAVNLEETITNEVVEHLKNYNFAWARDIRIKFKIDTKDNDAEKKLQAFKSAWDMGCRLKASDVMDVIGASMPDEDDEVLQNPAMQQQRLWDQAHPQEGDLGQGGGVVGQDGQEAPEGSVEDQFGPLAGELGQGGADGEPGAGGPDGGGGGNQPPGGPPQRFAKQVKSSPGQKSMFDPETHRANAAAKWKEELHPRGDGGQFAEKGSGHMPTATEAPGGIRAKTKKSSPGQNLLGLAGDAAEQIGQALPEVPPLADEPFSLSGKPVRGKSSIPGSGKTSQKDLFAGRGDSPGQTSFADDIDPASKKVADQKPAKPDEPPLADDSHLERARSVLSRIPHVSATGLVKQLGEGISVDQAHEILATLRGEKGEEKKETAKHKLTPEDRAALPEHLKGVTPIFPSETAKLKETAAKAMERSKEVNAEKPARSPALQSAIAQAHQELHEKGLAEKPKETPPEPDDIDSPSGQAFPDETPREAAARATKQQIDENYAFARKSAVANVGEDLLGSARHKRNAWKGLADAEKNGTADDLVTRDNLLKNEPHDLISLADENPLSALAMHYALRKFPGKPGYGNERVMARRGAEQKKKDRQQYHEAFQSVKDKANELAGKPNHVEAMKELQAHVKSLITKYREGDRSNGTGNGLVSLYNSLHEHGYQATSVAQQLKAFTAAAKGKYTEGATDSDLATHAQDIIEGKSLNHTFGHESSGKKPEFNPADLYVKHAKRKGGRVIDASTVKASTDFLTKNLGMRGVQHGNSVTDEERQHHLQKTSEAFADLADATGLSDSDMSLGGKLGMAFGARGHGTAMAHYEPSNQVINMTRKNGVGTLAHEWGHFFDHALANFKISQGMDKADADYMSERTRDQEFRKDEKGDWIKDEKGRMKTFELATEPLPAAYKNLRDVWSSSGFKSRLNKYVNEQVKAKSMSQGKAKYWMSGREVFARCFEQYVQHKLRADDRENTYLSGLDAGHPLWPNADEVKQMAPAFDAIFAAYKARENK